MPAGCETTYCTNTCYGARCGMAGCGDCWTNCMSPNCDYTCYYGCYDTCKDSCTSCSGSCTIVGQYKNNDLGPFEALGF